MNFFFSNHSNPLPKWKKENQKKTSVPRVIFFFFCKVTMQFAHLANYHDTNELGNFASFCLALPTLKKHSECVWLDFELYYEKTRMTRVFENTRVALSPYVCDDNIRIVNAYFEVEVDFDDHEENIRTAFLRTFSRTSIFFGTWNAEQRSILTILKISSRYDPKIEKFWICLLREFCVEYGIEVLNYILKNLCISEHSIIYNRLVLQAVNMALEACDVAKTRCQKSKDECYCHIFNQIAVKKKRKRTL